MLDWKHPTVRCSMARHMKRRKRTTRVSARKMQPRGFDYGCLPYTIALGSFEFTHHLRAAAVDGVAYGSVWSEAVNQTVPTISLIAQRGEELVKAFEDFNAWSHITDPDSVEITFVFRNRGGVCARDLTGELASQSALSRILPHVSSDNCRSDLVQAN